MHGLFKKASGLTESIIGAAIEVHRHFGPGLMESVYEWALCKELELRGIKMENQQSVVIRYKQLLDVPLGLLFNFHAIILTKGVNRLILPGANMPS